jgi:ATP/maltotriose-dependent transcriptional regulator MalT
MGKTNEEIGWNLGLATTIKKHLAIIFGKLGVEHRTAAALYPREFFPTEDHKAGRGPQEVGS